MVSTLTVATDRVWNVASLVWIAAVTLVVLCTFRNYGISYDEARQIEYGNRVLAFYTSGFQDRTATLRFERFYGGGFDLVGALVRTISPLDRYHTQHLLGGLVGVLGLAGVWRLGSLLWGSGAGFAGLVLLTLTPVYYGQTFHNPKDAPFAVGYTWAIYCLAVVIERCPDVPWRSWIHLGVAMGAAMSVRVAGLVVPCFTLLALALYGLHDATTARSADAFRRFARLVPGALAAIAIAWVLMTATWPWALFQPVQGPMASLETMSAIPLDKPMPYGDRVIRPSEVPWDYLPRMFLFALPEVVLILAAGTLIAGISRLGRSGVGSERGAFEKTLARAIVAAAILLPPAYAVFRGANLYDGPRHFLFLVPLIAGAAGAGAASIVRQSWFRSKPLAYALIGALAVLAADQLRTMIHLHPHEYVYFNRLAGGLPGAHERYEIDYLGAGYGEMAALLDDHLRRTEPDRYREQGYTLSGCFSPSQAKALLPPNFRYYRRSDAPATRDFWLGYTGRNCHKRFADAPVIAAVEREDTPLVVARDLRNRPVKRSRGQTSRTAPAPPPTADPESSGARRGVR